MQHEVKNQTVTPLQWVVCDIEGTVSPVDFVRRVLFPYARERFASWLLAHAEQPRVQQWWHDVRAYDASAATLDSVVARLTQWSDEDLKVGPLKVLQGWIWEEGYVDGSLQAPLYADVLPAFQRWLQAGLQLAIYSSGSIAAQQLFFAHSSEGDVRPFIRRWFDTTVGFKLDVASYQRIASELQADPAGLLFLSDHPGEVAAAISAGWQAQLITRDAGPGSDGLADFAAVRIP